MFKHVFFYNVKVKIRNKEAIFWNLCFPILLATLFFLAFGNLSSSEEFNKVDVAVVNNSNYQSNDNAFRSMMESLSSGDDGALFNLRVVSQEEASNLLEEKEVKGYIEIDKDINLFVKEEGYSQTILKSVIDSYKQKTSTITNLMKENHGKLDQSQISKIAMESKDYMKEIKTSKAAPDSIVLYYYALLAMTSMYAATFGLFEVIGVQANLSPIGCRTSLVPLSKFKYFLSSIISGIFVQTVQTTIVLLYMVFVLGINFGDKYPLVLLASVIGAMTGITYGTFISSIIKGKEVVKLSVVITTIMVSSFLAGMIRVKIKYIVQDGVPLIAKLNPVTRISDAFYSLYYYDDLSRYWSNIGSLLLMSIIFFGITCFVLRRQQYDSI